MNDSCRTWAVGDYLVQENGLVRDLKQDGLLIGKLSDIAKLEAAEATIKKVREEMYCVPHDWECATTTGHSCNCFRGDLQALIGDEHG